MGGARCHSFERPAAIGTSVKEGTANPEFAPAFSTQDGKSAPALFGWHTPVRPAPDGTAPNRKNFRCPEPANHVLAYRGLGVRKPELGIDVIHRD